MTQANRATAKTTVEYTFQGLGEDGTLPESFHLVKTTRWRHAGAAAPDG
jgi:hypothetical protein